MQLGTANKIEPIVAGGANPSACGDAQAGQSPTALGSLGLDTPIATTGTDPDGELPGDQTAAASAGAAKVELGSADGSFKLILGAIRSDANAKCVNGKPVYNGASSVATANLNGQDIPVEDLAKALGDGINGSPLSQLLKINFNEQSIDANGVSQRAAHVTLSNGQGENILDAIVGESRVTATGDVCANNPGGGSPGGGGSGAEGNDAPCPDGSSYDPARNLCIIEVRGGSGVGGGDGNGNGNGGNNGGQGGANGDGGTVTSVIVVGRPGDVPRGGTVVPLTKLTGDAKKSPCARNPKVAPRFAVVGTNKADKITGSNKADRIIMLGGKDKGSGGRGNDCIDGGKQNDTVEGALGNDSLYGMAGNDTVLAGTGNDRSFGGVGNDKIRADYGRDVINGGAGADRIVTTTLGPAASVNCGSGKDRVRVNKNERKKTNGCESRRISA